MGTLVQGINCIAAKEETSLIDDFIDLANRIIGKADEILQDEVVKERKLWEKELKAKAKRYTNTIGEIEAKANKYNLGNYIEDFEEISKEIYLHLKKSYSQIDIYLEEYRGKTNDEKEKWIKDARNNRSNFLGSIESYFNRFWFRDLQDKEKRTNELEIIVDCINMFGKEYLKNSVDINNFFNKHTDNSNFFDWFNTKIGKSGFWAAGTHFEKTRSDFWLTNLANFNKMWDGIIGYMEIEDGKGINLFQFLSIQSPAINETRGSLALVSEIGNLDYMFRYNYFNKNSGTIEQNRKANLLFSDDIFLNTHKSENITSYTKIVEMKENNTLDDIWGAEGQTNYPKDFDIHPDNDLFVAQADFYKFRGRGYIQVTHRSAYKKIAQAIQMYNGPNTIIKGYRDEWNGWVANETDKAAAVDKIMTKSKNKDWEKLFMETDYIVAGMAIKLYNSGYQVMEMNAESYDNQDIFNHGDGTFYRIGNIIGGSDDYGRVVRGRIFQMLRQLVNDSKNKQK